MNIFIPKKIKVGFQNRDDTYTKKLAYVIYYDQHDKLRKEASWNGWRDEKIEPEDYDNEPTNGFVLNKKVGGYKNYYDMRQTYVRVFDPRGFEFEITVPNLLYILENTSSIKGKGLEGEFVYGWSGKDLLLIPTNAPEYREMQKVATTLYSGECIKAKDLIVGATYATADGCEYVYMGKSSYWEYETNYYYEDSSWNRKCGCVGWQFPLDETWKVDVTRPDVMRRNIEKPKRFWFISTDGKNTVWSMGSIGKKFYYVVSSNVTAKFADYQDVLDADVYYSPLDYDAFKLVPWTFEEFEQFANRISDNSWSWDNYSRFYSNNSKVHQETLYKVRGSNRWYYKVTKEENTAYYPYVQTKIVEQQGTLQELYEQLKPVHLQRYLTSGKLYKGWY